MAPRKGYKHTEEAKKKISEAGKGRRHSEESKAKISASQKGRPYPEHMKKWQSIRQGGTGIKGENTFKNMLLREYNITLDDYNDILEYQDGLCRICSKKNENGERLWIDHNHQSGNVRGLLCKKCNLGLGMFNDDPYILLSAFKYLRINRALPSFIIHNE